jgi:hydrocephalus-inducing protein
MTSGSALPLNFMLKVLPPYFVDQENIILQPGKSAKVRVDFDPSFKSDRVSGIINGKMTVVHNDHPHRETVDLVGEVCFPNIKLASDMINFGSILNDTTKKIMINMQNIS